MGCKELIERLKYNGCDGCPHRAVCADDDTAECVIRVEAASALATLTAKVEELRAELEKEKEYTAFYQGLVDKYEKEIVPRFWKLLHKAEGGVSNEKI